MIYANFNLQIFTLQYTTEKIETIKKRILTQLEGLCRISTGKAILKYQSK